MRSWELKGLKKRIETIPQLTSYPHSSEMKNCERERISQVTFNSD